MILFHYSEDRGFTLIELILVLIILGILISLAVAHYDEAIYSSKRNAHLENIKNILTKAEEYAMLRQMEGKKPYPYFVSSRECGNSNLWEWNEKLGLTGWGGSGNPLAFNHPPICPLNGRPYAFTDCEWDISHIENCEPDYAHLIYYVSDDGYLPPRVVYCKP